MKVEIDGKEYEIEASQLKLDDGYKLITPDKVPDGYYTDEAFNAKFKDRLERERKNLRKELSDDSDVQREVLDKYGIQLDADGNPKGLKPTVDVDEVKNNVAERVKKEYEDKINNLQSTVDNFKTKGLTSAIVDGANKIGIDGKYLEPLVEGGSPYLVKELSDKFEWNPDIGDYALKESDGTFAVDGNGLVTTNKFFEQNQERFKHMLKDQRQRGSNFNGQGNPGNPKPKGNPAKWDRNKKLAFIAENGQDGYKEAINNYKKSSSEE